MKWTKKHYLLGGILLLVIVTSVAGWVIWNKAESTVTINDGITLDDAIAAALFSTNLISEYSNEGSTLMVLMNESGEIRYVERNGLESNSLLFTPNELLLHEKSQLLTINSSIDSTVYPYADDCYVVSGYGQSSGYLTGNQSYYSLFNQRISDDGTYYVSTLRWGNNSSHYCTDLHEYVLSSGHDEETIYLLTTDIDMEQLSLVKVLIEGDQLVEEKYLVSTESTEDLLLMSKLIVHQDQLSFMYSDYANGKIVLKLMTVSLNDPSQHNSVELIEYNLEDDPSYFFYSKESTALIQDRFYFVDGFGDVYTVDTETHALEKEFSLANYERQPYWNDEKVYFHNDQLYFFRYNEKKKLHTLEIYNLQGEVKQTIEIPAIAKITRDLPVHLYDFKVVQ